MNDYSWDELSQISREISGVADGNAAQQVEAKYHLVNSEGKLDGTQTKDVTLSDGTGAQVVITGFRHDERSDGSGAAGIAFSFTAPVDERGMSAKKQKTRYWSKTELRTWLAEDFAGELPEDLVQQIISVKKRSIRLVSSDGSEKKGLEGIDNDGDSLYYSAEESDTDDKLWLYSEAELRGAGNNVADALGLSAGEAKALQYELFANTSSGTSYGHSQVNGNTSMYSKTAWLRTPEENTRYGFKVMESDGQTNEEAGANPTKALGVVPGFCI